MNDYIDLPDVEAAVNTILRAEGIRAFSSIPGDAENYADTLSAQKKAHAYPLVTTQRLGGIGGERHALDGARVQVDAFGTNKATAFELVRDVWRIVHESENETVELVGGESVWISGVDDEMKPQFLQDPRTGRDRYIITFQIYARQTAPATS